MQPIFSLRCYRYHVVWVLISLATGWVQAEPESGVRPRAPWTDARVTGSPDPPLPYVTERAFPGLTFQQCLDMAVAPGLDRIFIAEQSGKIYSFPNVADVQQAELMVDLAKSIPGVQQLYAIAFHPRFRENRYCFVCYIKQAGLAHGTQVARFRVQDTEPPTIDVASETTIITWLSGGHNGCCLKFGPDGYLYISTGDGEGPNPPDILRAGQDITNLLSAILRIDVDATQAGRNYRIPADNPFVDLDGARGEIWAYGLRNPWRMSFDRSGNLWVGDVGWELWEMLNCVERGGNYGWSVMEGRQPANTEWERGPTPILPPTIDHPHSESSSITDGLTYYGHRLAELRGKHLYGDYDTGKIWAFRYVDGQVQEHREIADTTHRIVGFGHDANQEAYLLDHAAGTLHRLIPNPAGQVVNRFPRRLSETGLFASVSAQQPAAGVIEYQIQAEPWADHAKARRWVAVPDDDVVQPTPAAWSLPKDAVLAKTLALEMRHGDPSSRRNVETQLLHFDGQDWQPYTYAWSDDQSDAQLVDASGAERVFEIQDAHAAGGRRQQVWRYAGRAECQRCHNRWSGPPLAFNTLQLNCDLVNENTSVSQLDHFAEIGLIAEPIDRSKRPPMADPTDATAKLDDRARAYLHVNCAHCHRMHAGSAVLSQMTVDLPLDKTRMVGQRPSQGTFGVHGAQVIAPGDPYRSILLYRMAKLGHGHMPHLGASEVDRAGVDLIDAWIRTLPAPLNQETPGQRVAMRLRTQQSTWLAEVCQTQDADPGRQAIDSLLASTSGALMLLRAIDEGDLSTQTAAVVVDLANQRKEAPVRDLFQRFLPMEQRVKRLGSDIRADEILDLPGNVQRGRTLFLSTQGVQCKNCHRVHEEGVALGPDLTTIGKKYDRRQILESILEPSKLIDPQYVTYLVETTDGRVLTGLLVSKDTSQVVLRDATNHVIRIPSDTVEQLVMHTQSLMPQLLLRDLTAQQVADLLEYLQSLK